MTSGFSCFVLCIHSCPDPCCRRWLGLQEVSMAVGGSGDVRRTSGRLQARTSHGSQCCTRPAVPSAVPFVCA